MQFVAKNDQTTIYKDFAHSPSKLKATVNAMSRQFKDDELVAVMELHTFSSLNKDFLEQYAGTMNGADIPVVFLDSETFKHKKMPVLEESFVTDAFKNEHLNIFTDRESLRSFLLSLNWHRKNLLLMSSGNFGGLDIDALAKEILE
jgi:UDP-N-acetylmuramate: L-alanyl-gamma-D-glutamyl-meso-diaminopimelate ligase